MSRSGYSGHETGLQTTLAAVATGATLSSGTSRWTDQWGSDQAASVEPQGLARLVRDVRVISDAMGDGVRRIYRQGAGASEKRRVAW